MPNSKEILAELKSTHLGAAYNGIYARVYWKDSKGDFWSNAGYQTFRDENASVGTLIWGDPILHDNEEEASRKYLVN